VATKILTVDLNFVKTRPVEFVVCRALDTYIYIFTFFVELAVENVRKNFFYVKRVAHVFADRNLIGAERVLLREETKTVK